MVVFSRPTVFALGIGSLPFRAERLHVGSWWGVHRFDMNEPLHLVAETPTVDPLDGSRTFEAFYDAEGQTLFRRLWLITGSRSEAEELMQDAFLKVWERWERVYAMDDPVGYLYRTAMNLFRKRYRRAAMVIRRSTGLATCAARSGTRGGSSR